MRDNNRVYFRHFRKGGRLRATIATKMLDDNRVAVGCTYVDKSDRPFATKRTGREYATARLNDVVEGKKLPKPYMGFIVEHSQLIEALKTDTFFKLAPHLPEKNLLVSFAVKVYRRFKAIVAATKPVVEHKQLASGTVDQSAGKE